MPGILAKLPAAIRTSVSAGRGAGNHSAAHDIVKAGIVASPDSFKYQGGPCHLATVSFGRMRRADKTDYQQKAKETQNNRRYGWASVMQIPWSMGPMDTHQ